MSDLYASKRRDLSKFKRKTICKFPASKGDVSPVLTEGILEADFCYHLEADPAVIKYECQPLGYFYYLDKEKHLYTPDFKVWLDNGDIVYYEIKESKYITKEFNELFFPAVEQQAKNLERPLTLITEKFIHAEPLFTNLKRMRKSQVLRHVSNDIISHLVETLKNTKKTNPIDLFDQSDYQYDLGVLYKLIGDGVINANLESEYLGPEMSIWVDEHE